MNATLTPTETATVLRLAGYISKRDVESILSLLTDMVMKNQNKIVLNFKNVSHVSLEGISLLSEKNMRFRSLGGEIKLVGLIPYVVNLFKLVGAFSYFDVVSSEEEALARFES